jgi:hypothetical protein
MKEMTLNATIDRSKDLGFPPEETLRETKNCPAKPSAVLASTSSGDFNDVAERGEQPR